MDTQKFLDNLQNLPKILLLCISVIIIAIWSVNYGIYGIWYTIPFMLYLIYESYKHKKMYTVFIVLYIILAIYLSINKDKIVLLRPIDITEKIIFNEDIYMVRPIWSIYGENRLNDYYRFIKEDWLIEKFEWSSDFETLRGFINDSFSKEIVLNNWPEFMRQIDKLKKGDTWNIQKVEKFTNFEAFFFFPMPVSSLRLYTEKWIFVIITGTYTNKPIDKNPPYVITKPLIPAWITTLNSTIANSLIDIFIVLYIINFIIKKFKLKKPETPWKSDPESLK